MKTSLLLLPGLVLASLIAGCAAPRVYSPGTPCTARVFELRDDFPGARRGRCEVTGPDRVRLHIVPEDAAVSNPSPWYAMQLVPDGAGTVTVELDYGTWRHRYAPKLSRDRRTWRTLPPAAVSVSADGHTAAVTLDPGHEPLWLAAQELLTADDLSAWSRYVTDGSDASLEVLGRSAGGRPVVMLESGADTGVAVLLVGRQHPPELSGAFAMRAFLGALFAETALAEEFRARVGIIAIPMLNPDGVDAGHWRHNSAATDLNRDWGPFTQAETRLVETLLAEIDDAGKRLLLFMDFHSTDRNLFYTQTDADETSPPRFARALLERAGRRLPDYVFTREPRPLSETATAKNYFYRRYGIPSMTYEVADEADRAAVEHAASVFAEETMTLLLEYLHETG